MRNILVFAIIFLMACNEHKEKTLSENIPAADIFDTTIARVSPVSITKADSLKDEKEIRDFGNNLYKKIITSAIGEIKNQFYEMGLDVKVYTEGKKGNILILENALFNNAFNYQIKKKGICNHCIGTFEKIYISDGYNYKERLKN